MTKAIFHYHLFKNAGTSLDASLKENFEAGTEWLTEEFPANYFPWKRLDRRGVKLRWVNQHRGRVELDDLDRACRGALLLAISFVQYLSGFRIDLDAVGEICHRQNCLLVIDAVQG